MCHCYWLRGSQCSHLCIMTRSGINRSANNSDMDTSFPRFQRPKRQINPLRCSVYVHHAWVWPVVRIFSFLLRLIFVLRQIHVRIPHLRVHEGFSRVGISGVSNVQIWDTKRCFQSTKAADRVSGGSLV